MHKMDFLLLLGKTLHQNGTSAHTLEAILSNVASQTLNCECEVFSTPTSLMCSLKYGTDEFTRIVRTYPGEINLEKLCKIDDIADDVVEGSLSVGQGVQAIRKVHESPNKFNPGLVILSHGLAATGGGLFFGIDPLGLASCFINGLIVGVISDRLAKQTHWDRIYISISAFVVSVLTLLFCSWVQTAPAIILIIPSLIVLIPGLELTLAVSELSTQNLVSGSARFMNALTIFLKLTLGVFIATKVIELIGIVPVHPPILIQTGNLKYLALPLLLSSLTILFHMRWRDLLGVCVASTLGFLIADKGNSLLGQELSLLAAGLTIGVVSHTLARFFNKPVTVTVLPSLILLVPGSLGLKGFSLFASGDHISGAQSSIQVLLIAIILVGGLFLSHIIIPPRREL